MMADNSAVNTASSSSTRNAKVRKVLTKIAQLENKPINPTNVKLKSNGNYPPVVKRNTVLDIDCRFFPKGLQPGMLIELRGPEGSGKTFLCTYFLARYLFVYPNQLAVYIDATLHFNVENLVSMLKFMDPELCQDESDTKLMSYLSRVFVLKCCKIDELLMVIDSKYMEPHKKCQLEDMLLKNSNISFVLVDGIDQFSSIRLHGNSEPDLNIINLLRLSVESTHAPVICTTHQTQQSTQPVPGSSHRSKYRKSFVQLNTKLFTHTMTLKPLEDKEMTDEQMKLSLNMDEIQNEIISPGTRPETYAYLRRNDLDVSHRVKFSILSGMLWVCEDSGEDEPGPPPVPMDGDFDDPEDGDEGGVE